MPRKYKKADRDLSEAQSSRRKILTKDEVPTWTALRKQSGSSTPLKPVSQDDISEDSKTSPSSSASEVVIKGSSKPHADGRHPTKSEHNSNRPLASECEPELAQNSMSQASSEHRRFRENRDGSSQDTDEVHQRIRSGAEELPLDKRSSPHSEFGNDNVSDALNNPNFRNELESRWILSLSMHFRDGSDKEKFFITYIEERNRWRRITVSCEYLGAQEDSLEVDIKSLHFQRDKNARIYEAIRDSLPDIQFYDTVTNLKLETSEQKLHVHVTEDVNEIIDYPLLSAISHLHFRENNYLVVRESDLYFDSHLSGFVYKVMVDGKIYIKKEIPSPDTVEEFLYEVNALAKLRESNGVINLEGVVVDDGAFNIKGLLVEWAQGGSLNDFFFDHQGSTIPWAVREKWAYQIVSGMRDIHEAGFIQGDCTISNIVLDSHDDAKIVDINRRGCPIGWEPPEFRGLIESGQRVSMYIGVKSDIFQLGMILWGIAMQNDEPEREERPLGFDDDTTVPKHFVNIIDSCLANEPADRMAARSLWNLFQDSDVDFSANLESFREEVKSKQAARPDSSGRSTTFLDEACQSGSKPREWENVSKGTGAQIHGPGLPFRQDYALYGLGEFGNREVENEDLAGISRLRPEIHTESSVTKNSLEEGMWPQHGDVGSPSDRAGPDIMHSESNVQAQTSNVRDDLFFGMGAHATEAHAGTDAPKSVSSRRSSKK